MCAANTQSVSKFLVFYVPVGGDINITVDPVLKTSLTQTQCTDCLNYDK